MAITSLFINGCSFLTSRPKAKVYTHCGLELANLMKLDIVCNLAGGGRGNKRLNFTTKVWCEKNPKLVNDCFFLIGSSSGSRFDYPTNDGFKKHKFPSQTTTWKTFSPNKDSDCRNFFKYLMSTGADVDEMMQIETVNNLLDLQNYFEIKKYPYVMYNTISDGKITNADIKLIAKKINTKRYFKPETSHLDFVEKNNYHCQPGDPHPNVEGHKEWAKQLKEFIDASNLRTI